MKKQLRGLAALWGLLATAVLTAMVLTTATYAWFSSNRKVETGTVTSQAGSSALELQISRTGGNDFTPGTMTNASGETVNSVALNPCDKELLPVSTADLQTFVYCPVTDGNMAARFLPVQDDSLYYHDTIYLRAVGSGLTDNAKVELYLDHNAQQPLLKSEDGQMPSACRLGLSFDGGSPVIVRFGGADQGSGNTILNGVLLGSGQVLDFSGGTVTAADDPAVPLEAVQVSADNATRRPLAVLKIGQIYRVDVYFYLEGCDPDCVSDRVGLTESSLNLAFFGQLVQ